jgi:hypothetical protein
MAITKVTRNLLSTGIDDQSNATAITIDSSGNVEIGSIETATSFPLIVKSGTNDHAIAIEEASGGETWQLGVNVNGDLGFYNSGATTSSVSFIDAAGQVLIGEDTGDAFNADAMLRLQRAGDRVFQSFKVDADQEAAIFFGDVDDDIECGITYQAANQNLIFTTGDNSEALRIDSSGNVGIGTSSPLALLDVAVLSSGARRLLVNYADSIITLQGANSSSTNETLRVTGDNLRFATGSGTGTERMRIDSNGSVCIGATAPITSSGSENLFISGTMGSSGYIVGIQTGGNGAANRDFIRFYTGTTDIGAIEYGSDEASVNYVTSSDYRLKQNVQPLVNGLDRVKKLKPVKFNWKESGATSEGFLAHEIQEAGWYEGVSGKKDDEDMQGVDYGRITPLLVKAIQEQQTIIDDLKTRIETLENA